MPYKTPVSILLVIHTPALEVLLLERLRHPGYWQSVTGSVEEYDVSLAATALREAAEETGFTIPKAELIDWRQSQTYEIYAEWRDRYAPGVTHNTEHVFSWQAPQKLPVRLAADEHRDWRWLSWREAAAQCFSPSNRAAILDLPRRLRSA